MFKLQSAENCHIRVRTNTCVLQPLAAESPMLHYLVKKHGMKCQYLFGKCLSIYPPFTHNKTRQLRERLNMFKYHNIKVRCWGKGKHASITKE